MESEKILHSTFKQHFHLNMKAWSSEKLGDDFKHEVLGVLTHEIQKLKGRIDVELQIDQAYTFLVEGFSVEHEPSDVADLLSTLGCSVNGTDLIDKTRMLPVVPNKHFALSQRTTKAAKIRDIVLTADMKAKLLSLDPQDSIPRELYFYDDSAYTHAVEIPITEGLSTLIKLLESLNCVKWQIEKFILRSIENAIGVARKQAIATGLRIATIRQETSQAAGGRSTPHRLPCSEGRMHLILKDASSVNNLIHAQGMAIQLRPLPKIPFTCRPWVRSQDLQAAYDSRTARKQQEAKEQASKCVPPRTVLSKIDLKFKVKIRAGANIRQDVKYVEQCFEHAMGGIKLGIAAVQLSTDTYGQVNPQGRGTIWVCDLDDDRTVCKELVERLKCDEAALYTEVLSKIGCRQGRPPLISDCADPEVEELTLTSTRAIIMRYLCDRNASLVIRSKLADGTPLQWRQEVSTPNLPLTALGPALQAGNGLIDIREAFSSGELQPTVNLLWDSIGALVKSQLATMYEEETGAGEEVRVIRLATLDDWIVADDGAQMSD